MTSSPPFEPPQHGDVLAAHRVLDGYAVETPLLESAMLNERLGGRLLVKAEPLQRTGSFKFRGAFNRLCRLDQTACDRGVVAFSSGNHAQGVALAARMLGVPATIVMPRDAPAGKLAATRAYGARVVLYDRQHENREAIGQDLADRHGLTLIRTHDDPWIVAGQGTVALEAIRQAEAMGSGVDLFAVPCGGGGLTAGCGLALIDLLPETRLFAIEPAGHDDTRRSLADGRRVRNAPGTRSFCDALLTETPGDLTFGINRVLVDGALAVEDAETADAMRAAFTHLKLVVEPGGAVALAAVLSGHLDIRDKTCVVACSGGNVDVKVFREVLDGAVR